MYTGHQGVKVAARKTGPDCNCPRRCFSKVDRGLQYHILHTFNNIGDNQAQNLYLRGLVVAKDPYRLGKQGRGGVSQKRKLPQVKESSFEYYVPNGENRRLRVCRRAFASLHGITYRRVRTVRKDQIPSDRRGKHAKKNVAQVTMEKIKTHIRSFPRMTSHYSRKKNPRRRFLNPGLSVNRMHMLYLQKHEPRVWERRQQGLQICQQNIGMTKPQVKPEVSLDTYRRVFNGHFNLSFGLPRSDTCSTCDEMKLKIDATSDERGKAALKKELNEHHRDAERGYKSLKADKLAAKETWKGKTRDRQEDIRPCSKDAVDVFTFDFQQNLPTPNLSHGKMFYARQLWTYNFGIHDCISEQGYMFMWPETTAKRGSSEVASCLVTYLKKFGTGAKSLASYSDNRVGQNKNLALIGAYSYLLEEGVYESLDHKFMYKGHSFLPNDRDYGQTEKRKASAAVNVPKDWFNVFREANLRKPFNVVEVTQNDILDWKTYAEERHCHKRVTTDGSSPVSFSKVHWINFGWGAEYCEEEGTFITKHHPDEVWLRYSSTDEPWKKVRYLKNNAPARYIPPRLYNEEPLPLKAAKVKDLKAIAQKFLPPHCRAFSHSRATTRRPKTTPQMRLTTITQTVNELSMCHRRKSGLSRTLNNT